MTVKPMISFNYLVTQEERLFKILSIRDRKVERLKKEGRESDASFVQHKMTIEASNLQNSLTHLWKQYAKQ